MIDDIMATRYIAGPFAFGPEWAVRADYVKWKVIQGKGADLRQKNAEGHCQLTKMRLITRDEPWNYYDRKLNKTITTTRKEMKRLDMHFKEKDKCENIEIYLVNQTYLTY